MAVTRSPAALGAACFSLACSLALAQTPGSSASEPESRLAALKRDAVSEVEQRSRLTQQIVDSLFSFSEIGYQEFETQRYLATLLERNGFEVTRGVAGMPSAWVAKWGSGRPVIALGADVDGLPTTNQKPGVVSRSELVPGAPGHGEGHNAGPAVVVTAALAAKAVMARERLSGTLVVWPGIAEELLAGKAFLVRAGVFRDVDAVLYAHVASTLGTWWGDSGSSGLVSVEYSFAGDSAHAARAPWRGHSALDAVELMDIGWNFKREHLRLAQRSHYVISHGGDQPNVVPPAASVWYYFRENDAEHVRQLWDVGNQIAQGAALMTGTSFESRVLGSAWPLHANRPLAEAVQANIEAVGPPTWSDADQQFARAVQRALGASEDGLATKVEPLAGRERIPEEEKVGGASDDVGDVMWSAPTAMLQFPSNIAGTTVHHWTAAIAMATPVAHKGATQGAKVYAMTVLDLVVRPELVTAAHAYFADVQGKQATYEPLLRAEDEPVVSLNKETMDRFRPELAKHRYDPQKYSTYLEQLGVQYPPPLPDAPR
jgi:aminobenzoyl-glutamate utilization protein B